MGINEQLARTFSPLVFALFIVGLLLVGCDQQTEGCLDFRALTVTLDADDPCDDCCVYPSLELQFIPVRFDSDTVLRVLRGTDTLINVIDTGTLSQLGFYLHDITLIANDGERFIMQDSFTVFSGTEDPNFVFESSILRVTPFRQTSYSLGTLLEERTFVAVEASLGLPDELSGVAVAFQPTSSPLSVEADSLMVSIVDNALLDAAFKFETLAGVRDSFQLLDALDQKIRWELPSELDYTPSFNALVTVGLPVDQLLTLDNGTVNGELFVNEFLSQGKVLEIALSRP